MKGGNKLFIFAGVGLALVAVVLAITSLSGGGQTTAKKETKTDKVKVVEAKSDIGAFTILTVDQLTVVETSTDQVPADAVTDVASVIGMTYSVPLRSGQTLMRSLIETPGLRNDIAVGKRAISLPVDEVSAMAGLVQGNDYIDIVYHARINIIRVLPSVAEVLEEGQYEINQPTIYPPDLEQDSHPLAGDPGSTFVVRDDIGELSELEPVAKVMLQDIRVLRVIRPGDEFLGDGSMSQEGEEAGALAGQQKPTGQLILEVTPEQAEMITFMQDQKHKYQVVVRGKDDHEIANTKGVTFEILTTDPDWSLPYPKSVSTPKEQPTRSNSNGTQDQTDTEGGTETTTGDGQTDSGENGGDTGTTLEPSGDNGNGN